VKVIIHKYIFHEMWPAFLSTILVFTLITVGTRMLSLTEWVVDRGVHPSHIFKLIFFLLPNVILFALPAASLIAVLVAFLRMSKDSEIIALNSLGISLYQMLPPVIVLSLVSYLLASFIALFGAPWGNRAFKETAFRIIQSRADVSIKERVFYEPFDDVVFYVNSLSSKDGVMKDVFVVDKRDKTMTHSIVSKKARILFSPENQAVVIHFEDGTVFIVEKDFSAARTMKFKTYDLNLSLQDLMSSMTSREKAPKEMYIGELLQGIKLTPKGEVRYNTMVINLLESFTIPLAVFFMGLIGAPLGAQIRARGRSLGIGLGLMVFLIYYLCVMGARGICENGTLSPFLGMWFPVIFLLVCCAILLKTAAGGEVVNIAEWFRDRASHWRGKVKGMTPKKDQQPKDTERPLAPRPIIKAYKTAVSGHPGASALSTVKDETEAKWIGNSRVHKLHRSDSQCEKRIAPRNRVWFKSKEEALEQAYVPCKICKP